MIVNHFEKALTYYKYFHKYNIDKMPKLRLNNEWMPGTTLKDNQNNQKII